MQRSISFILAFLNKRARKFRPGRDLTVCVAGVFTVVITSFTFSLSSVYRYIVVLSFYYYYTVCVFCIYIIYDGVFFNLAEEISY